jgi:DNA-binding CsgD family transcriptional regulator/Tfp pilus assembly protein PilF
VTADAATLLAEAQAEFQAGNWAAARSSFEAALEREESAEALLGLGNTLWWVGETEASVRHLERAYAAFRRRPDPVQAALAAVYLSLTYRASLGNHAAAQGWLGRAARLADEHDLAPLRGWVALCRAAAANDGGDPAAAERWAREAQAAEREFPDGDLELCALSELGAALVEIGRVAEGTALLDEAMAGSLGGEVEALDTVVMTCCNTIICCSRAGDFKRATQWVQAAEEFNRRYGSPHLYTVCRTHYGSILFATGRWAEAESELRAALRIGERAEPAMRAEAIGRLAELRLAQGRHDEAARLLAGLEHHPATVHAATALHLARGEPAAAAAIAERRLREVGESGLEGAALLELWVEAESERDPRPQVAARARRLVELSVDAADCPAIVARGERALGRALLATGEPEEARPHLERALSAFASLEMPFECERTRLLLARVLAGHDAEAAIADARPALARFEHLGAARDADAAAAFLRSLGVKAARRGPRGIGLLTKRERDVLALLGEGLSNPEIADRLVVSRKTVEHHVASVLSKLGLRGRAEAAAYAVRELVGERDSATK